MKKNKKAILFHAMHGPIKYNTHFCQSKGLSVMDSGTGTVSLRCLSPHEPGGLCKSLSILGHQVVFEIHHKDRSSTLYSDLDIYFIK